MMDFMQSQQLQFGEETLEQKEERAKTVEDLAAMADDESEKISSDSDIQLV